MKRMRSILLLALCTILMNQVDAACFTEPPRLDKCGGTLDCKHNCRTIAKGTSWKDYETCVRCECTKDGFMHCCGIGYNAGVIAIPEECKMKKLDRCKFRIVYKKDECKLCKTPRKFP